MQEKKSEKQRHQKFNNVQLILPTSTDITKINISLRNITKEEAPRPNYYR